MTGGARIVAGVIFIIIGIPLLLVFLIGLVPIAIGIALVNSGRKARRIEKMKEDSSRRLAGVSAVDQLEGDYREAFHRGCSHLVNEHNPKEALKCFDEALKGISNDSDIWAARGNALKALGRLDDALLSYDKALTLSPYDETVWVLKVAILREMGRHDEAQKSLDHAMKLKESRDAQATATAGAAAAAPGVTDRRELAQEALPQSDAGWFDRGNEDFTAGKWEEALVCYDQALRLNPKNDDAWDAKGTVLFSMGKGESALGCYDSALKVNPRNDRAWGNKGKVLYSMGQREQALKCCYEAIRLNPSNSAAIDLKGSITGPEKH